MHILLGDMASFVVPTVQLKGGRGDQRGTSLSVFSDLGAHAYRSLLPAGTPVRQHVYDISEIPAATSIGTTTRGSSAYHTVHMPQIVNFHSGLLPRIGSSESFPASKGRLTWVV